MNRLDRLSLYSRTTCPEALAMVDWTPHLPTGQSDELVSSTELLLPGWVITEEARTFICNARVWLSVYSPSTKV